MHYTFLDIGASFFDTSIDKYGLSVNGVLVEPLKLAYDLLPESDTVKKINVAISDTNGVAELLTLKNFMPKKYLSYTEFAELYDQHIKSFTDGTFDKEAEFFKAAFLGCSTLHSSFIGYEYMGYETIATPCNTITFAKLCTMYNLTSVDEIKIDAEGWDHIILQQIFDRLANGTLAVNNSIRVEINENSSNIPAILDLIPKYETLGFKHTKIKDRWSEDVIFHL